MEFLFETPRKWIIKKGGDVFYQVGNLSPKDFHPQLLSVIADIDRQNGLKSDFLTNIGQVGYRQRSTNGNR
jgi:hypothetical protein